jgi:hypothetical protein
MIILTAKTSQREVSPLLVLELLSRIHQVIHKYCCAGDKPTLTTDLLRANFSTVYLLLDEMVDAAGKKLSTST